MEATSAHAGEDIKSFAYRDIKAGEQLFMSYNECNDTDCEGLFHYGTMEIMGDYGFVEEYPQRWIWDSLPSLEEDPPPLVLVLDHVMAPDLYDPQHQTEQFQVTWQTEARPDLQMVNFMSAHLEKLENLEGYVQDSTQALTSDHERYTIRQFHKSIYIALQYTILSFYDQAVDDDVDYADKSSTTRHYDTLEKRPVIGNPKGSFLYTCHPSHERMGVGYQSIFMDESQYQTIEFKYGEEEDDTCLWLSGWGQTCSSFRQYHEALVHYPASFLPEIKRVVYIGGGDNMILHEILKYPSIELVVGLELDQEVVRYSFMNMGTLPYFDDPRVQWWFGDATKSLLMLPKDYFGSFDLVLVDLQTFVADSLFVTEKLSIMDTMKLLLKPNGIISKNEDFPNRKITDFAKYTVDMEYCDLPQICRQSITIGSNGINFVTANQYRHNIETIYMTESLETKGRFNNWYDFRDNTPENKSSDTTTLKEGSEDSASSSPSSKNGVLVVIEAEKLSKSVNTKEEFVAALTLVLGSNGIEVLEVDKWAQNESHFDLTLLFRQGYLSVRKRPLVDDYVAMDMVLWDEIDKINLLKREVIESIGGDEQQSSSYRLVTGGIKGVSGDPYLVHHVPEEEVCENPEAAETDDVSSKDLSLVWKEFVKLIPREKPSIVVLCGLEDDNCDSWEVLNASSVDALALYTCETISEEKSQDETMLLKCEVEMAKRLRKSLSRKINGIWLDATASKTMAKVLLRLLTGQIGRTNLLDKSYCVLSQLTGEEWREIFFERLRTEVSPFAPAKEARLSLANEKTFSFFSAGDKTFYTSLVNFMGEPTIKELKPILASVMSGHASYIPDFSPQFFNNQAYSNSRAYLQWKSQQQIGFQTIFQMELQAPKTPLKAGEEVLFQYDDNVWLGMWTSATVVQQNEDLTYDIETEKFGIMESIPRDSLRRLDFDVAAVPIPTIDIGARVLYRKELEGTEVWLQGFVISRSDSGREYEVREYAGEGLIREVDAEDLMPQFELTHAEELPSLSRVRLEKTLRRALSKIDEADNSHRIELQGHGIGEGCMISAFWNGGNTVLVWDGANHIDINFFLDDEDEEAAERFHIIVMEKIPFLSTMTRDEQPRGYGRVVNFESEINRDEEPIWWYSTATF